MNLPVRIVIDRAGCVGGDGETHQGIYDIAFMNAVPNLRILTASTAQELMYMIAYMEKYNRHPISVRFPKKDFRRASLDEWKKRGRYPRGWSPFDAEVVARGKDALLITEGTMLHNGLQAKEILEQKDISIEVLSLKSIRPLDEKTLRKRIQTKQAIFTLENHTGAGGVGTIVQTAMASALQGRLFHAFAYPDEPIAHGSIGQLEKKHGLDGLNVALAIRALLARHGKKNQRLVS